MENDWKSRGPTRSRSADASKSFRANHEKVGGPCDFDDICEVLSPVSESRGLAVSYLLLELLEAPELQSRATENAEKMFLVSTLIYDVCSGTNQPITKRTRKKRHNHS